MPRKTAPSDRQLIASLEARFTAHGGRHRGLKWDQVLARLQRAPAALRTLGQLENTGGEPDVIGFDEATGQYLFVDCSAQSPAGRRSVCYDAAALKARKANKPKNSAVRLAATMGARLLTVTEYQQLQSVGEFDTTTSSWVDTPPEIRALGGALFCDRRYDTVFTYHNGADSYYAARGFRCALRV